MATCIVVDDEPHCIDLIKGYIAQTTSLSLGYSSVNPIDALQYLLKNDVDIIFLDVNMPQMSGVDFLEAVKGKAKVIMCTAYPEYAIHGFENDVADYLLKPITYARFMRGIQKALGLNEPLPTKEIQQPSYIFVKTESKGKLVKISFDEIDYIQGERNYVSFHCEGRKKMALLNMKDLANMLPPKDFIRIHNSYIVPLSKISMIEGNEISLMNGHVKLPVGITFKEQLMEALNIMAR